MREIGISPRFSRDKFVPLQTKQRYSTRDISGEVSLTLFFRGFVPFLSLADFVSRNKNLQVADLQRLKSCFGELVTATTRRVWVIVICQCRVILLLILRNNPVHPCRTTICLESSQWNPVVSIICAIY